MGQNHAAQVAFDKLKTALTTAPVLGYPDAKYSNVLDTDASDVGVGAVCSQLQYGEEKMIACFSKTMTPPEKYYSLTRQELLGVIKALIKTLLTLPLR